MSRKPVVPRGLIPAKPNCKLTDLSHIQQQKAELLLRQQHTIRQEIADQGQIQLRNSQLSIDLSANTSTRLASMETTMATLAISSDYYSKSKRPRRKESPEYADVADLPTDFRLARLFLGHVLLRSFQGWKARLGFWPALKDDAPQFWACLQLDLGTMKELFRSRKASPFDRDSGSYTFLHVCIPQIATAPSRIPH